MGAKASRIVEEYRRFETQLHNLNDQNTQLQQQNQDLATRLHNSEKALNCYSWQIDTLHNQLEHSETSLHHYGRQIDTLHGQLETKERELEIKEKENAVVKKELIYFQWRQQLDHRVFGEVLDLPRSSSAKAPPSDIASITSAGDQPVDEYGNWIHTPAPVSVDGNDDEVELFNIADEEFEDEAAIDADDEISSEEEVEEEIVAPVLRRQGAEGGISTNPLKRPITSISTTSSSTTSSTTTTTTSTSTSTNDPKNLLSTRTSQYSSGTDGAGTTEEEILRTAKRAKKWEWEWEWDWEGNGPEGQRRLVEDMRRARGGDLRDYE